MRDKKDSSKLEEFLADIPEITFGELYDHLCKSLSELESEAKADAYNRGRKNSSIDTFMSKMFCNHNIEKKYELLKVKKELEENKDRSLTLDTLKESYGNISGYLDEDILLSVAKRIVELDPNHSYGYEIIGGLLEMSEKYELAKEAYLIATKISPSIPSYKHLISTHLKCGEAKLAEDACEKMYELAKSEIYSKIYVGEYFLDLGLEDRAEHIFTEIKDHVAIIMESGKLNHDEASKYVKACKGLIKIYDCKGDGRAALVKNELYSATDPSVQEIREGYVEAFIKQAIKKGQELKELN